jgi:streptogramin lyase
MLPRLAAVLLFAAFAGCRPAAEEPTPFERADALLEQRLAAAPKLPFEMTEISVRPPAPGWELGMISSVAEAADGTIYLLQRGEAADPVVAIDREGRVLRSWGAGLYSIPHSVRVDPRGRVWTVDSGNSHIYRFSPQGEVEFHLDVGGMPEKSSPFRGAADVAFTPEGGFLVADGYGNARVLEYDGEGRLVRQWGEPGTGPGKFHLVHAIALDERGIVYVSDRENGRIQRFDRQGRYLDEWPGLGRAFSLTLLGADAWIGTQRLAEPNGSPGWLLRVDRDAGTVRGYVPSVGTHSISPSPSGEILTGARPNRVLRFIGPRP